MENSVAEQYALAEEEKPQRRRFGYGIDDHNSIGQVEGDNVTLEKIPAGVDPCSIRTVRIQGHGTIPGGGVIGDAVDCLGVGGDGGDYQVGRMIIRCQIWIGVVDDLVDSAPLSKTRGIFVFVVPAALVRLTATLVTWAL